MVSVLLSFMELAHREFLISIKGEYELASELIKSFTYSRIPVGIFEFKKKKTTYFLAVEVEASFRSPHHGKKILQNYQKSFEMNLAFNVVILVATKPTVFTKCQKVLKSIPKNFAKKVLLFSNMKLNGLNKKNLGVRWKHVGNALEFACNHCANELEFIPMKSNCYEFRI